MENRPLHDYVNETCPLNLLIYDKSHKELKKQAATSETIRTSKMQIKPATVSLKDAPHLRDQKRPP